MSLIKTVKQLISFLSPKEASSAMVLVISSVLIAIFDALGVASVMPFVAIATNPDLIETNIFINHIYNLFFSRFASSKSEFVIIFGFLVLFLLISAIILKSINIYLLTKFVLMREFSISLRLVKKYLAQSYSWFVERNSTELGKNILTEVREVINVGFLPIMTIISQGAIIITMMVTIFLVDFGMAIVSGGVLLVAYVGIFRAFMNKLTELGESRLQANSQRFVILSEAFGAIRDVKIRGLESVFHYRFERPAQAYAFGQVVSQLMGYLPRFFFEAIAFCGFMITMLYWIASTGDINSSLPKLSLIAVVGYKLMPAFQQCYGAFTQLAYAGPAVNKLYEDLDGIDEAKCFSADVPPEKLRRQLELKGVSYQYPSQVTPSLEELDLVINVGSHTGIVGETGCGKTTIINLILGLIQPSKGCLVADGLDSRNGEGFIFQRSIGYVPQDIFLIDGSVFENIAFPDRSGDINKEAVLDAAKIADIHDFVINELPEGYSTCIGERGARLSGGQKQRIGLARALYKKPEMLVLDEATSSLDFETQRRVMKNIASKCNGVTIISIAHRSEALVDCDILYYVEGGAVVFSGSFSDVLANNKRLGRMAANLKEKC